jgi:hypothetical protein
MSTFKKLMKKIFSSKKTVINGNIVGRNVVGGDLNISTNSKEMPNMHFNKKIKTTSTITNDTVFQINILENTKINKNVVEYFIPEEYKENIVISEKLGNLKISTKGNIIGNMNSFFNIYTSLENINKIKNNSVGKIIVDGLLSQNKINIKLVSTGNISLREIQCEELNVVNEGVGRILFVEGKTTQSNFTITSTGGIEARDIISENIKIESSGIGELNAFVSNQAKGKLTSIGSAIIHGDPKSVLIQSESIGKVKILSQM